MVKKSAVAGLALVLLVVLVLVVRAQRFRSRQVTAQQCIEIDLDRPALLKRMSRALQFRTISSPNAEPPAAAEFERFHAFLLEAFPRVSAQLEKELIGVHSLLYSWPGADRALKPILLLAHMDVEPATEENWRHPPFSGTVADGFVWGRGAMDDKSSLMAILEAVEHLLREGFAPARTVWPSATTKSWAARTAPGKSPTSYAAAPWNWSSFSTKD